MSGFPQCVAGIRRAPILPNDGMVDRAAARPLPHNRGLALVGDADAGDIFRVGPCPRDRRADGCDDRRPDVFDIVLDQA